MRTSAKALARGLQVVVIGLFIFAVPAASSAAAAPGVGWQISQRTYPTVLAPGSEATSEPQAALSFPQYKTEINNIGAGDTTEAVVITQTFPVGITVSPVTPPEAVIGGTAIPCKTTLPATVTCTVGKTVKGGGNIQLTVPVDVAAAVPSPALSEVTVTGGGPGALPASGSMVTAVGNQPPDFEVLPNPAGLSGDAATASGLAADLAGSHPLSVHLETNFPTVFNNHGVIPLQDPKQIEFNLPPGLVVDPQAPEKLCTDAQILSAFAEGNDSGCPPESKVGSVAIITPFSGVDPLGLSLYAMQPAPGVPAEFAFSIIGLIVRVQGGLNGYFHLTSRTSDILTRYPVLGVNVELWGDISDPIHDSERNGRGCKTGCSIAPTVPFVTMPTSCGGPLGLGARVTAWQGGSWAAERDFRTYDGGTLEMEGCNALEFEPSIEAKPTTNVADSPTGLDFRLHQPQNEDVEGRATAALKDAVVTLPQGVTINPSGANGLGSCTEEEIGYEPEEGKALFSNELHSCPNSAKIGTLEVATPLLDHKLQGSIFLAKPFANPLGSQVAIYLAVEDDISGTFSKLVGKVEPDPATGQLKATFRENPQLPLEDIELHFFGGPTAALTSPLSCGNYTTNSTLTPWSTPEGVNVHPTDSFQVQTPPAPGPCPGSEAQAPNTPTFSAGTVNPLSGAFSPFVLRIARADGTQRMVGIDTTLPEGLVGKAAGVPYCSEADISLAKSREAPERGKEELASPSCPAASEVGTVQVTAGAGIAPLAVSGRAYWAGPYKGAPLSMVVIIPGVAGPFDLGNVVSRVALYVGQYDARIHAVSDPLPTIIDGIPVDVRSIELKLSRSDFTLNPTSCEAMAIEGSVLTQAGQTAPLKNRFQVGECGRLGFKPKLSLTLNGGTKRNQHPALKSVITYPKKGAYANVAKASVTLPASEFIDQAHIGNPCIRPDFAAEKCPKLSILGRAKAWSPLLDKPLEGKVYFRSNGGERELPDVVVDLNGQIHLVLVGFVDSQHHKGSEVSRLRTTFAQVPDAPVSKFILELKGGKEGLLVNSGNLCKVPDKAIVKLSAQNGKTYDTEPAVANDCGGKSKKGKTAKRGAARLGGW